MRQRLKMQLILLRGLQRKKSMKNPIDMTAMTKNPNGDTVKTAGGEEVLKEQCYAPDEMPGLRFLWHPGIQDGRKN